VDHPNDVWGWGILDTYAAVQMAQSMTFGDLQGQAVDSVSGNPVPNADIFIEDTTTGWTLTDTADGSGNFARTLPAGTYNISGWAYGYLYSTVPNVVVTTGGTTTQNVPMDPASLWTVSGQVLETGTGNPLAASVEFVNTPVMTYTDGGTGNYAADVAEGTWWMRVASPGHATEVLQASVDQDLTINFDLDAIYNYYMRSGDATCGAPFAWVDATDGTPHPLSDDSNAYVNFGQNFTFYGASYSGVYIGSNGLLAFTVTGSNKWSGPIPDPAAPNNGIYAFSTDLDPSVGSGMVYHKWVDGRYFVTEWYQVQHFPSGYPETFEIILDFQTGAIKIQYLTVSNPTDVVAGVENAAGSEATQYAYNDPVLIADNTAVFFFPTFGTPPSAGGLGTLMGTVTDLVTSLPIPDASVFATAYATGEVFQFVTDGSGGYTADICDDWYLVYADAMGYEASTVVPSRVLSGTQTIEDFALQPAGGIQPPAAITQTVVAGQMAVDTFDLANTGSFTLNFTMTITPTVSWLALEPLTGSIPATSTQAITATFDATSLLTGEYTTSIELVTDDPEQALPLWVPVTLTVTCDPVSGADFEYTPANPVDGEVITFTASATGTPPILYAWDFGDGLDGMGDVVTHTYAGPGNYTVAMTATNCGGEMMVVTHTVTVVSACEPVHDVLVDWTPITPTLGTTVTFDASALGSAPFTFEWVFSDGFTATGATVDHIFAAAGAYTVTLTVDNCAGIPVTVEYLVTVVEAPIEYEYLFLPFIVRQ
jgi:PKD repeat protein